MVTIRLIPTTARAVFIFDIIHGNLIFALSSWVYVMLGVSSTTDWFGQAQNCLYPQLSLLIHMWSLSHESEQDNKHCEMSGVFGNLKILRVSIKFLSVGRDKT